MVDDVCLTAREYDLNQQERRRDVSSDYVQYQWHQSCGTKRVFPLARKAAG
jgi:hypothetical protein